MTIRTQQWFQPFDFTVPSFITPSLYLLYKPNYPLSYMGEQPFNQSAHARHLRTDGQIKEDNFGGQRPISGWTALYVT